MRSNYKTSFLISMILAIVGCQNYEPKEPKLTHKEYGKWDSSYDSLGVELELSQFKSFKDLLDRVELIVCNDSVPKIILKTDQELKTIYFGFLCPTTISCFDKKNTIKIHNDTISMPNKFYYPMDSLEDLLKRDIENNGYDPYLSISPVKLVIFISYNNDGLEKLPKILDKITQAYEKITNKTDVNIILEEQN